MSISLEKLPTLDEVRLARAYVDFSYFVDYDSEYRDREGKHLDVLDDALQRVSEGKLKRLIVTMPPRHGKSERISKKFPAWHLGRNPNDEMIIASYSIDLARDFSKIAKDTFIAHQNLFEQEIDPNNQSSESWGIKGLRGRVTAAGVGGSITGKGARIAIVDDPIKNYQDAQSEVIRENLWGWYRSTLYTRLTPDGSIVVVQTRWHEDDLVGRLLSEEKKQIEEGTHVGDKWTVINFPAIAEENDYLGREVGQPLWPEYGFGIDELMKIKSDVGSYVFNALYQQRPSAAGGTIFKREYFRYFREEMIGNQPYIIVKNGDIEKRYRKHELWAFQTVDTANSEKTINDPFVVSTWYVTPQRDLLLYDVYRTHITGPDQKPLMRQMLNRFRPRFQAIEDKTFGTNLIQEMKREGLTVRPIKVDKDKVTRSLVIAARYEVGMVYHREDAQWLTDYEDELLSFPRGKHDDQVDTASMAGEVVHTLPPQTREEKRISRTERFDTDDEEREVESTFW